MLKRSSAQRVECSFPLISLLLYFNVHSIYIWSLTLCFVCLQFASLSKNPQVWTRGGLLSQSYATSTPLSLFEPDTSLPYAKNKETLDKVRKNLRRPLTLAGKCCAFSREGNLFNPVNQKKFSTVILMIPTKMLSLANPTSNYAPTAWRCKTPLPKWQCFSSCLQACQRPLYPLQFTAITWLRHTLVARRISKPQRM